MAAPQSPIGSRRRLGAELRRLRHEAGLTLDDVAERMTCSTSKISRLETGKGIPKVPDVSELMRIYGVSADAERGMLLRLVHEGREHGWWEPLADGIHHERHALDAPGRYAALEGDATRVLTFDVTMVPGLLQTEDYAHHLLRTWLPHHSAEEIERLLAMRTLRRAALDRGGDRPPLVHDTVIDEAVLHRTVGGPAVMAGQLQHLLDITRRPNVMVRVLPFAVGMLRAHAGQFVVLDIPAELGYPVVYVEGHAGEAYLDSAADVARYKGVFLDARRHALPPEASRELIGRYLNRFAPRRKARPS